MVHERDAPRPLGGAAQSLNIAWKVAGTGDYDGDGKADIVWRNSIQR